MTNYRITDTDIEILGTKFDRQGRAAVGAYVQVIEHFSNRVLARTNTDVFGQWLVSISKSGFGGGRCDIRFIHAKLLQNFLPAGDWETLDVAVTPNSGLVLQPIDIFGQLDLVVGLVSSTVREVISPYAVNSSKLVFTNNSGDDLTVSIDSIEIQTDARTREDHYVPLEILTIWIDGVAKALSDEFTIPAGQFVVCLTGETFRSVYKVRFTGAEIGNPLLDIKVVTYVGAHEIEAGRIRVEEGIVISAGGVGGVIIDEAGISQRNEDGLVVGEWKNIPDLGRGILNLGNLGTNLAPKWGFRVTNEGEVYAGGWSLTEDEFQKIETGKSAVQLSSKDSRFSVYQYEDSSYQEVARVGVLSADGLRAGLWGSVGGIGGTPENPALSMTGEGIEILSGETPVTFITSRNVWRKDVTAWAADIENVVNGSFDVNMNGWTDECESNASATIQNTHTYEGANALCLESGVDFDPGAPGVSQTMVIEGGSVCKISFASLPMTDSPLYFTLNDGTSDVVDVVLAYDGSGIFRVYSKTFVIAGTGPKNIVIRFQCDQWDRSTGNRATSYIDSVSLGIYSPFSELNLKGLFIGNTPASYVRFGSGLAEIKVDELTTNAMTVMGDLKVYGQTFSYTPSASGAPILVLNSGLPGLVYGGLELDDSAGSTNLLFYDRDDANANKWKFGSRLHAKVGTQLLPTWLGRPVLADVTSGDVTVAGSLTASSFLKGGVDISTVYSEIYTCPYNIESLVPITIPGSKSYKVGSNKLLVFINGVLQQAGTSNDYREVGNTGDVATTVMFNYNIAQDSKITFIILCG